MWFFHIWPTLMLAMRIAAALDLEINNNSGHLPRQASKSALAITTVNYSSAALPTPASGASVASNPPAIVIPFLPPSTTTTPQSSTFLSTSALSSVLSSKNATTSPSTSSLSSAASPTSSAQDTTNRLPIKSIYLIPAVVSVGILLGGLIGWVVYRCMTRKLRVSTDDGALLIGPRYIAVQEPERHHIQSHGNERRGQPTQMKNLPGAIPASSHFRWPSFNEKPTFDPDRGFHVPDEYLHEDDSSLALPLTTRSNTNVNTRTKSTRTFKSVKSIRRTPAGPSRNVLSPTSDTTSLALLELYESDEEEETRRKAREIPWESLRHKSIKRGIIEQVKKEGKWMDSIRGLPGSTLLGSRHEPIMEEGDVLLSGPDVDGSMEVDSHLGRRRSYSIPDSDPFADSPTGTHRISPKKRPVAKSRRTDSTTATFPASLESHGIGFQIIPESAVTTPNHSPRSSIAWLKKADASQTLDKLTRLPTPIAKGREQGPSPSRSKNSRSTSPVKRTLNNASQLPRRDVLPLSPAQLMSPPLQSQICFTPIPGSSMRIDPQSSIQSRVPSPTKPLVISSVSKSKRKVRSPHNLHRLPKLSPSANTDSQHEVSQGRVLQRPITNNTPTESRKDEDAIKKVERIMASSWSARDLGPGAMRNLSPTGFGRHL